MYGGSDQGGGESVWLINDLNCIQVNSGVGPYYLQGNEYKDILIKKKKKEFSLREA